jgi:SAM-dependent methyltransferase
MDRFPLSHAERLEREREFHNVRFAGDSSRDAQSKYYWAIERGAKNYETTVFGLAPNRKVLEYGCGEGAISQRLGPVAKSVVGIDISDVAISKATASNQSPNVTFQVMDATKLLFADDSFDLVFGSGIVHHLDTQLAAREVSRVLRLGGKAVFWEPTGGNPMINLYRKATPGARTVEEHPLLTHDFEILRQSFRMVEIAYFGLTTLAALPFRTTSAGKMLRGVLEKVDAQIFALWGLHRLAWFAFITCTK